MSKTEIFYRTVGQSLWTLPPRSNHASATSKLFSPTSVTSAEPLFPQATETLTHAFITSTRPSLQWPPQITISSQLSCSPTQRTHHSLTFTGYSHDDASTPTSSSSSTNLWTILHPHNWLMSSNITPPPATWLLTPIFIVIITTANNNNSRNNPSSL